MEWAPWICYSGTYMFMTFVLAAAVAYSPEIKKIPNGKSGYGTTTRYWDCCKPSCSWAENVKTPNMVPIASCAVDGVATVDPSVQSGCNGGTSYMCNNQQPFIVNDTIGYGFAAVSFSGGADTNLCCSCYLLTFLDQIQDKKLVLQFTNTGGDLNSNQFDIALPGGGIGIFNQGCHDQWNAPWTGWGDQYGGVHTREECLSLLPEQLQSGCLFRFDFMNNADNPQIQFEQVECPDELVQISGCNLPPDSV